MLHIRTALLKLATTDPAVCAVVVPLTRQADKWKSMPKGWDTKSRKKFWDTLVGDNKHKVTKCIKEMGAKGDIDDPGAFCASLADRVLGKDWRRGKKARTAAHDQTPNAVDGAAARFKDHMDLKINEHFRMAHPAEVPPTLTLIHGNDFIRVVKADGGLSREAVAFIARSTGNVYLAHSWDRPKSHVVANVLQSDTWRRVRMAFNQNNATELLGQLKKVLLRSGLDETWDDLAACKVPQKVNDAWMGLSKKERRQKSAKADVKPVRQRTQYSCMAASMTMCLRALGHELTEDEVNQVMGARPMKGAAWEQALATAQHYGCRATLTMPATVEQLKAWTDAGIPIMIAWNPEGRDWSHASVVFDVDDDLNVYVADPNLPNPKETVRVVSENDFYGKWYEKFPNYLVRRPACAIEREITVEGKQVPPTKKMARGAALGDCFEAAGNLITNKGVFGGTNLILVHGEVQGQGPLAHTTFGHAWIEDGNTVLDYSNGGHIQISKKAYYAAGHINEIGNTHRYTWSEFRRKISKFKHWGPWDLKTSSGL